LAEDDKLSDAIGAIYKKIEKFGDRKTNIEEIHKMKITMTAAKEELESMLDQFDKVVLGLS